MTETTSERNPIDVLADEFSARLREGSSPSVEEYAAQYPELAEEIRATFPSIAMMERISQKEHTERKFERQTSRLTGSTTQTLGDFQIVREVGRGGMGIVYEAVEKSLKRRVALKVLGPSVASSPKQIQRFLREAEAAARLHHTNIVPVYGIGQEKDLHFFAMQFIEGVPLSDVIRSVSGRSSTDDSALTGSGTLADRLLAPDSTLGEPLNPNTSNNASVGSSSYSAEGAARALLSGSIKARSVESNSSSADSQSSDNPASAQSTSTPPEKPGDVSVTESAASRMWDGELQRLSEDQPADGQPPLTEQQQASENGSPDQSSETENALPEVSVRYWRSVARIVSEVADALHYSHQHGVLHRDIKPSNLLLDRGGVVWITDFGLACHEDQEGITNTGDIVGTLRYMAPEQFSGETTSRSDIYSLGLTLYELLALRPAFEESRHGPLIAQKTSSTPPLLRSTNRDIPRDLETITQKASATNPADRYATAGELAADLRRFLDDRPVLARPATATEQLWRWSRRNPVVALLSGATVVLLATVAVVFAVGQYRTSRALELVEDQKSQLEERKEQLDDALLAERKASRAARTEFLRAEQNLQLAVKAFDSIINNIASRGVPKSLSLGLGDDELNNDPLNGGVLADGGLAEVQTYDTVLTTADADLLETLLVFFDEFAGQNQTDLRAQSATARKRVGDIQQRLGRFEEAEATYKRALEAFETLASQNPDDEQLIIAQAKIHNEIAIATSRRGAMRGAVAEHSIARRLLRESPGVLDSDNGKLELARTLGLLTTIGSRTGFSALMALNISDFSSSRSPSQGKRRDDGPSKQSRSDGGKPQTDRDGNNHRDSEKSGKGGSSNQKSANGKSDHQKQGENKSATRSGDGNPKSGSRPDDRSPGNRPSDSSRHRNNNRDSNSRNGSRNSGGSRNGYRNWKEMFRGSSDQELALLQELIDGEPSRPDYRLALAIAWRNRVTVSRVVNDPEMGMESINTAIEHLDELARDFPDVPAYRFELADTLCVRAGRPDTTEKFEQYEQRIRRAVVLCEDLIESYPNVTEYQALMGTSLTRLGTVLHQQKKDDEAVDAFTDALAWQRPLSERFSTVPLYQVVYLQSLWGLSEISLARNDPAAAIAHLDTAIERLQVLTDSDSKSRMLAHYLEKLRRRRREITQPSGTKLPVKTGAAG